VKQRDLAPVAELVAEQILAADDNRNGFSKDEIATLPPGFKAIFLVGQMAEAGLLD
jgi:hypothetical protein